MKKSLVLLCAQWAIADEGYSIQMQKSTSQLVDELGLRGKIFLTPKLARDQFLVISTLTEFFPLL